MTVIQPVAVLLAVAVIFAGYFVLGINKKIDGVEQPVETATTTVTTTTASTVKTAAAVKTNVFAAKAKTTVPQFSIDTTITSGPKNGEIIKDTNKLTFKFEGKVYPENKETIYFDTKLVGQDKDWIRSSNNTRTVTLAGGTNQYTFLARARTNTLVDSTPATIAFGTNLSPYFGKLKFSNITQTSIILASYLSDSERIDITGWQIKGSKGTIVIPKGVELYLPSTPFSQTDILVKKNDRVNVLSGTSPLTIRSFKPNKCFGYLKDYYTSLSTFSYSKICPKIDCKDTMYFSAACQTEAQKLQNCLRPTYTTFSSVYFDPSCNEYINNYISENLNYEGCVENYYADKDFYKEGWYVYAGPSLFCRCVDSLYLYDTNGLLVDRFDYERK
ncbi:MAG: hypothetical protein PHE52_02550 [Candidatus Pacebacteria bacterium]|nr:hypothetical protein [Candidatus Paceibacterota bacterium]